jgi:hypothetical protein
MVNRVLDVFEKQPVTENSEERQIEKKYPKFLSKYKLINLQFNDFHFRETFMIQILILFQSLKQPINIIQTKYFKILNKKAVARTKARLYKILTNEAELDAQNKKIKSEEDKDSEPTHLPSNNLTRKFITRPLVNFIILVAKERGQMLKNGVNQILNSDRCWVSKVCNLTLP